MTMHLRIPRRLSETRRNRTFFSQNANSAFACRRFFTAIRWAAFIVLAGSLIGCGGATSEAPEGSPPSQPATDVSDTNEPEQPAVDEGYQPTGEKVVQWRVTHVSGSKIGQTKVIRQAVHGADGAAIRIELEDTTRIKRFDQITEQAYRTISLLKPDGSLIAFQGELVGGPTTIRTHGRVVDGKLRLKTDSGKEIITESIPWEAAWGGLGGDEVHLEKSPLKEKEERSYTLLAPVLHRPIEVHWKAKVWSDLELPDGRQVEALEIDEQTMLGDVDIRGRRWIDRQGRIVMQDTPSMGQTTYSTDEKTAMSDDGAAYDLGNASIVKLDKPFERPHDTRRAKYLVSLKASDPSDSFEAGASQSITKVDERTVEVEVYSLRPTVPERVDSRGDRGPNDEDLGTSPLVQSKDPAVLALAEQVEDNEDTWQMAKDLEQLVNAKIDKEGYTVAMASAADVAKNLEGDCTDHAVLLAALCRAKGIPARIAVGLVYFPAKNGFAFHMWNEVWIGERWTPLDATLGKGGIGAAHLKVATSSLNGGSPYAAFLKVFPLIQQLQIRVVESE